ncbi:uncharacterized protein MYCFIDRAFT_28130 [Pseudocercospora fijiensis CIRAD86]|uniref:DUF455 domain protein n=1 Tax=Pseudocercospora fijiensis (strain CIRAD86) TaxID=383855 RepID=N1QCZ6_PSEFD|nr:uncharacterized protein MYCFIDRAFT_28130 [Pseudocercospora fijiensis CIRAD86]EME89498.1 hypothetical protein MYCFIDRAFT_28130 [Pseudocercospora fijiensis CIRAD86]
MPFAVWCHTCKPHAIIAQGVRFNAEKRKVGNYYSTPIWSFRMRHTACDGAIEIRTDPKNTAYVVVEGGKARDYGDANDQIHEGEGGVPILSAAEREQRREDAFAQLEGRVDEKEQVKDNTKRIQELYESRDRDWDDPWVANKRMRSSFRQKRKAAEEEERAAEAMKERLGTDIDLLPASAEDSARAKLVSFGNHSQSESAERADGQPMFRDKPHRVSSKSKPSSSTKASRKEILRQRLLSSTRAALNPFGS